MQRNDPVPDPSPMVFEFARQQLGLDRAKVAVFASWQIFRFIENRKGTIYINAGYQQASETPRMEALSRQQFDALTAASNHEVRPDSFTLELALEYLKKCKPRLLYIQFTETDIWARLKRYDRVLQTIQFYDRALERLWTTLQGMPEFRGSTTLLVATDHGRGLELDDWSGHGSKIKGAEQIWIAAMGPDTPTRGEAANTETVYQRDISATILALAGLEWRKFCGEDYGRPVALIAGQ